MTEARTVKRTAFFAFTAIVVVITFVFTISTILYTIINLVYPDLATIMAVEPIGLVSIGIILLLVRTV